MLPKDDMNVDYKTITKRFKVSKHDLGNSEIF